MPGTVPSPLVSAAIASPKRGGLTNDRTRRAGTDRVGAVRGFAGSSRHRSELSQLSLEQLADLPIDSVFSASMYMQKVTEAPSSVTIITADEIRGLGHRTLADVLRTVRGFYITYDRNYSYLGVRGFSRPGDYNARVLLQVDGHRLNDNVFGSALIGTEFPLDVDLIERIEIIRGPSSALYGTNAFFAVINVITRRGSPRADSKHRDARELRRARRSWHLQPTVLGGAGTTGFGDRLSHRGSTGTFFPEFDDPATNNGIADGPTAISSRNCSRGCQPET